MDRAEKVNADETTKTLDKAIKLLVRCYNAGHRDGWQDGETNDEVFDAVNDFLDETIGPDRNRGSSLLD